MTHVDRPRILDMFREQTKGKAESFIKTEKSAHVVMKAGSSVLLVYEEAGKHNCGAAAITLYSSFAGSELSVLSIVVNKNKVLKTISLELAWPYSSWNNCVWC